MIKNETRESAHLRSRVKDLSVVPNVVSFTGLFAAITPIAKLKKNDEGLYDPVLIRDTDSLIANFGDPRIDPEKYVDLYDIMQVVGNGTSCYVAKVNSGDAGVYKFPFVSDPDYKMDSKISKGAFLEELTSGSRTVTIDRLKNKYAITKIFGYKKDSSAHNITNAFSFYVDAFNVFEENDGNITGINTENAGIPDTIIAQEKYGNDLNDKYTWDIIADAEHEGEFKLTITFVNAEIINEYYLVAYGAIDPSWGAEPIMVAPKFGTIEHDGVPTDILEVNTDTGAITLESTTQLNNEYILLENTIKDLKNTLKSYLAGATDISIEYTYDGRKLKITATPNVPTHSADDELDWTIEKTTKIPVKGVTRGSHAVIGYSSMAEDLTFKTYISQTKPYSLHVYYLNVEVLNADGTNTLGKARVKLEDTTTNQSLVNNLNSSLGTIVRFELIDPSTEGACIKKERGANSIVKAIMDAHVGTPQKTLKVPEDLEPYIIDCQPKFKVSMQDYIDALEQFKAKKYAGCLMADLTAPVSRDLEDADKPDDTDDDDYKAKNYNLLKPGEVYLPSSEDRRALHYNLKQIACERKDCTVILSTPYYPDRENQTAFTLDDACDWVTSQGRYSDLWEYGVSNTVDYSIQSFYLEIYFSWLMQTCTKIESGLAKSVKVLTAPANLVINNVLTSYRERGVHLPVAGDQYGTLPETCAVTVNPKTKAERDQLVQCRINPIYDTGTRGIQIYGNETLNAAYTDLNAAHIARTLVRIRSQVDEYTETLKFLINSQILWDQWKNYVSMYILEPYKSVNALAEYSVKMGEDTTSREEIANRTINGIINLRFYQSAEIFDLTFAVYSTATTLEAEGVL